MFHLDHLCLFVRDLGEGVRGVHEETGLAYYEGGVLAGAIGNTIFPLGGDAYLEVEALTVPAAERDAERAAEAAWIDRIVADGDRWLFWSLRADTLEEMAAVARRLGGEVVRVPGRVQPDGIQRVIERGVAVARLEIGADAGELREHIGAETFDRLPLAVVPGRPGVHAVTVRTASGREVTLRREPADLLSAY